MCVCVLFTVLRFVFGSHQKRRLFLGLIGCVGAADALALRLALDEWRKGCGVNLMFA